MPPRLASRPAPRDPPCVSAHAADASGRGDAEPPDPKRAASQPLSSCTALYAPRLPPAPRGILGVVVSTGLEAADRVAGKAGEDLELGSHLQLGKMEKWVARVLI